MNSRLQRILVVLLAVLSVTTTLLIVLMVLRRPDSTAGSGGPLGVALTDAHAASSPSVFDHPMPLPPFTLTERSGESVGLSDLRGKVWVAGFIFTHCPGPCPRITSAMAQLQEMLSKRSDWDRVRLVSFSVDPQRDTPARLREYAGWAGADPEHWLFVTGDRPAVWDLVVKGFKQPVGDNPDNPAEPIVHSQRLVLVDAQGQVRGFYNALDERLHDGTVVPHERDALMRDIERLLAE